MLSRYYAVLIIARGSPRANRNAPRIVIECILRDTRRNGLNVFARSYASQLEPGLGGGEGKPAGRGRGEGQDRVVEIGWETLDRGRGRGGEVKLFFSAITSRRQSRRNGGMGWEERRDKEIEIQDKREEKSWLVAPVEEVARYIVKIKRKINR